MSRSYKHTPIFGFCKCESEKKDKQTANRKLRRKMRIRLLRAYRHRKAFVPVHRYEAGDVWTWGKDGKVYYTKRDLKKWSCNQRMSIKKILSK